MSTCNFSNCYREFAQCGRLSERHILVKGRGGFFIARIACWWIFWLTLFCLPAACIPFLPPLPFYCSCRLWGCQSQVWRARQWEGRRGREKWRGRIDRAQVASLNACASAFPILICIDKMAFSLCLTLYFPHSLLPFTHVPSIHFQYYFCFLPAAVAISWNKLHFHFLFFFSLSFPLLFVVNCLFSFLPYLQIYLLSPSLLFGLAELCFLLTVYAALQYSRGGGLFSPYMHFRDRAVPQLSPFISHPLSLAPMTVFN